MGADGALIASAGKMAHVPAFKVNVVDTTGAGDAFMGGLSYGLLQDWDHRRVGLFANACAAICCTKVALAPWANAAKSWPSSSRSAPVEASSF